MIWGAAIGIAIGVAGWFQRNRFLNAGTFRNSGMSNIALLITIVVWAIFGGLIGLLVEWLGS
jgi:hypothetical protein